MDEEIMIDEPLADEPFAAGNEPFDEARINEQLADEPLAKPFEEDRVTEKTINKNAVCCWFVFCC